MASATRMSFARSGTDRKRASYSLSPSAEFPEMLAMPEHAVRSMRAIVLT
jgi:hypothetical protein